MRRRIPPRLPRICGVASHYATTALSFAVAVLGASSALAQPGEAPFQIAPPPGGAAFASAVAAGSDVNNDGHDDIFAFGPDRLNNQGERVGIYYMFSGKNAQLIWERQGEIDEGMSLVSKSKFIGDQDNDGIDDLIIGHSSYKPDGQTLTGMVEIRSGRNGDLIRRIDGDLQTTVRLGMDVTGIGDVNDDQIEDYAVVSRYTDDDGLVTAYSGKTGELLFEIPHSSPRRIRSVGDIDGDQIADIAVSRWRRGPQLWILNIYSGVDGHLIRELKPEGDSPNFGYSIAAVGDLTGDDVPDVMASFGDEFILFSGKTGSQLAQDRKTSCSSNSSNTVLDWIDLTGDGYPELIVQATGLSTIGQEIRDGRTGRPIRYMNVQQNVNTGNQMAFGDFNNDGVIDIVHGGFRLSIFAGANLSLVVRDQKGSTCGIKAGDLASIELNGAQPRNTIHFFYTDKGLRANPIPGIDVMIHLNRPFHRIATAPADAQGRSTIRFRVPRMKSGWIQAIEVDAEGQFVSNSHVQHVHISL